MGVDPECQSARVPEPEQLAPLLCPFLVSITLLLTPLAGPPRLRPLRSRPGKLSPFPAQSCPVLPVAPHADTHLPITIPNPVISPPLPTTHTSADPPIFATNFPSQIFFTCKIYITFFEKAIIHSYKLQIYIYIRS